MYSDHDTHRWVGCPIRISTDQSLLAAPHGFSQRATSFVASWCQGIHRMPFSRSIAPHAQKPATAQCREPSPMQTRPSSEHVQLRSRYTHASDPRARNAPTSSLVQRTPGSPDDQHNTDATRLVPCQNTRSDTPRDDATAPRPQHPWWTHGGGGRDRTDDPLLAKQVLSQLSYAPKPRKWWAREDLNLRPHAYQACALTN